MSNDGYYLNNPKLKKVGVKYEYSEEDISEYIKCRDDIEYFFTKYVKIINVDKGIVAFEPYEYQKKLLHVFQENRFVVVKSPRQSGKSVTSLCFLLHYVLFSQNKSVAILANKATVARELLSRIQLAYENLPKFLQQGIISWNRGSIELENGCSIITSATSSSAIRGFSVNLLYLDEYSFIPPNMAHDFFTSVFPTISSGESTKVFITSTPKGYNHFYKLWTDAVENNSGFFPYSVNWDDVPGRDEAWKEAMIAKIGMEKWLQEFEAEFLGSSNTLIPSQALKNLAFVNPLYSINSIDFLELPIEGHRYNMCVDVARGTGNDFSAFVVIDITNFPYKVVAKYKNNFVSPLMFPNIIEETAKKYNFASVLVEVNDIGGQISDTLYYDLEYENIIFTTTKGKRGQQISSGYTKNLLAGVRTTASVKKVGCATLKTLIEEEKFNIEDFDIIQELANFVSKGNSFEADEGYNDDLVMCLVLFSWLVNQKYFKEDNNIDIRKQIFDGRIAEMEEALLPIIGFSDGFENIHEENDFMNPSDKTIFGGF